MEWKLLRKRVISYTPILQTVALSVDVYMHLCTGLHSGWAVEGRKKVVKEKDTDQNLYLFPAEFSENKILLRQIWLIIPIFSLMDGTAFVA